MRRSFAYPLLLAILTIVVFGRIVSHDFTYWDDAGTIHHNPRLNPPTAEKVLWYWGHSELGLYIPVTYSVWGILATAARLDAPDEFGIALNPWLFHAASLIVHVGSALLVFGILQRLSGREGASFVGALLFAIHPLQTETVAWASGLKDLLCGFFALLAIWEYMQFAQESTPHRRWHYVAAMIAFVLSMLSKATGMLTPVLAGIIAYWGMRRTVRQIALSLGPWLILSAACGALAKYIQPALGVPLTALWTRPLIAGDALAFYLGKLLAPINLSIDYGRRPVDVVKSPWIYFAWLIPAAAAIAVWRVRKPQPLLVCAALLFLAGLLPVLGLVPFLMQYYSTVTDHYLYLPMLGLALAGAWVVSRYERRWVQVCAAVVLLIFVVLSFIEAGHWQNELTLSEHTVAVNERSFTGHTSLGNALARRGRDDKAAVHFRRSIELNPEYAVAYEGYSQLLMRAGKIDEATENVRKYIQAVSTYPEYARPDIAGAYTNLGNALLARGKYQEAIGEFEKALKIDPNRGAARLGLQQAKEKLGRN
jgi:protein O-mannosyl-transferase